MRLGNLLNEKQILLSLPSTGKHEAISTLVQHAADVHQLDADMLLARVLDREKALSTGVGQGVAVPHATLPGPVDPMVTFGRAPDGIDYDSIDGEPVYLLFLLLSAEEDIPMHLKLLSRVSRLCHQPDVRAQLLSANDENEALQIIQHAESSLPQF